MRATRGLALALLLLPGAAAAVGPSSFVALELRDGFISIGDTELQKLDPKPVPIGSAPGDTQLYLVELGQLAALAKMTGGEVDPRRLVAPSGFDAKIATGSVGSGGEMKTEQEVKLMATPTANGIKLDGELHTAGVARHILPGPIVPQDRALLITTSAPLRNRRPVRRYIGIHAKLVETTKPLTVAAKEIPAYPAVIFNSVLYDVPLDVALSALSAQVQSLPLPRAKGRYRELAVIDDAAVDDFRLALIATAGVSTVEASSRLTRQTVWTFSSAQKTENDVVVSDFRTELRGEITPDGVRADLRITETAEGKAVPLAVLDSLRLSTRQRLLLVTEAASGSAGRRRLLILGAEIQTAPRG